MLSLVLNFLLIVFFFNLSSDFKLLEQKVILLEDDFEQNSVLVSNDLNVEKSEGELLLNQALLEADGRKCLDIVDHSLREACFIVFGENIIFPMAIYEKDISKCDSLNSEVSISKCRENYQKFLEVNS